MNKKFLLGLSSATIAMSFVACGSGEVNEWTYGDENALVSFVQSEDSSLANLRDRAVKECSADPACAAKMGNESNPATSVTSSATVLPSSSASIGPISSSSIPVLNLSSSSFIILPDPESSAEVVPPGQYKLGTCGPASGTISKSESTKWKFELNQSNEMGWSAFDMIEAEFSWSFDAGATASGSGSGFSSPSVEYSTSGKHSASLKITKGTVVEEISCAPLQVNGAPITGCECKAVAATADVADGGVAGWTIDGCMSTGATITGYAWTGATGEGQSASHTFAEKGETLAPKVEVSNDDSTVETVTCEEVKAIDSRLPDYAMATANDSLLFTSDVDITVSMTLPENWHGGTAGNGKFVCSVTRGTAGNGAISGSVDGVAITGADYVAVEIPVTSTIGGYSLPLVLSIGKNEKVICKVGW